MKTGYSFSLILSLLAAQTAFSQSTSFTYQGRLNNNGSPANGSYDLRFLAFPVSEFGNPIGPILTNQNVSVSDGLFTVTLDFGANVFTGAVRYLEIGVRTNGTGNFTALVPRQEITASPYALYAPSAGIAASAEIATAVVTGSISNSAIAINAIDSSRIIDGTVTASDLSPTLRSNTFWSLTGNAGANVESHFLGTTDTHPVEIRVNNQRVLRLEPGNPTNADPNVVLGSAGNMISLGTTGSTIGGGGALWVGVAARTNAIGSSYSVIAGGMDNIIANGSDLTTISGGGANRINSSSGSSTISGGWGNITGPQSTYTTIGGGGYHSIRTNAYSAAIAGGLGHDIENNAWFAFIGGGGNNTIQANAQRATIAGGFFNVIGTAATNAFIGGGKENHANAVSSVVSGGESNVVAGAHSSVIGGVANVIQSNATNSFIGGGYQNVMAERSIHSFLGGGVQNSFDTNASYSFLGGGFSNRLEMDVTASVLGGGWQNTIQYDANGAFIGAGQYNVIGTNASWSTIPGGFDNEIGNYATNAFAAGYRAKANHAGTLVWADRTAADFASTGVNQFIVRASGGVGINTNAPVKALHVNGDVQIGRPAVWANTNDDRVINFGDTNFVYIGEKGADDRMELRAGGFYFNVGHIGLNTLPTSTNLISTIIPGCFLSGAGVWVNASDRNLKQGMEPVDTTAVLEKVAELPLSTWHYKAESADQLHMGPMAQDFRAAFGLGYGDTSIASIDADGVALAAIQGLHKQVREKDAKIADLESRLEKLEQLVEGLAARP